MNTQSISGLAGLTPEEVCRLPKKTLAELAAPALPGERHNQLKRLVIPMIAEGFAPDRVFEILRGIYDYDVSDNELSGFIRWTLERPFEPSLRANGKGNPVHPSGRVPFTSVRKKLTPETKMANAERFLKGFRCTPLDLYRASPAKYQDGPNGGYHHLAAHLFLLLCYQDDELINLVRDYKLDASGRAMPVGAGLTKTAKEWRESVVSDGVPRSDAGCWFRINPVKPTGSGKGGAYTDNDVTRLKYILLESDCLPFELQASLLAKLPLPIVPIIDSGGKSLHAIVKVHGEDPVEVEQTFKNLELVGIDAGNSNPSRLSRFPGAFRRIGARGKEGIRQSLVYLDNAPLWSDTEWDKPRTERWEATIL